MSTVIVYRVDKRAFASGIKFQTAGEFSGKHPIGADLELQFDAARPAGKPKRADSLFLFETLKDAQHHWIKMGNGVLYECEVDSNAILHRGDMEFVDCAGSQIELCEDPSPTIADYWLGESTANPRWELLVDFATITRVISAGLDQKRETLLGGPSLANTTNDVMKKFWGMANKTP